MPERARENENSNNCMLVFTAEITVIVIGKTEVCCICLRLPSKEKKRNGYSQPVAVSPKVKPIVVCFQWRASTTTTCLLCSEATRGSDSTFQLGISKPWTRRVGAECLGLAMISANGFSQTDSTRDRCPERLSLPSRLICMAIPSNWIGLAPVI